MKVKALTLRILKSRWLFRSIGLVVFILILFEVDLDKAWRLLKTVDPRFVLLSLVLQAIGLLISTLRWQFIMRQLELRLPFSRSFIYQLIGTAAALVTPGQLGEFIKVLYHHQEGLPVPESLLSVFIDRALDLLLLLLFGIIALTVIFGVSPTLLVVILAVGGLMLVISLLFAQKSAEIPDWLAITLAQVSPKTYRKMMRNNTYRLAQHIGAFKLRFLLTCMIFTILNYLLLLFRVYALVLALHIEMPFWYFAMTVPLLRLVGLVPISVLGIGTRDLTAIYLFGQVGVPGEAALLISALGLITLQVQALSGVLVWQRFPLYFHKTGPLSFFSGGKENVSSTIE